jgi:bifunctional oligoribonuclease and PAP phosphatase NrnA
MFVYNNTSKESIIKLIKNSQNVVISAHTSPDGDAVGSILAVYHYLRTLNKNVYAFLDKPVPYNYTFLPGASYIKKYEDSDYNKAVSADLIIIVDLNDPNRLKSVEKPLLDSKAIKILIDHHIEPKEFADYYYIYPEAAATGELIYDILKSDKEFVFTKEISENLYTAILTDTGSFRFSSTSPKIHEIIADLIRNGADPAYIYDSVYNTQPANFMLLYGKAIKSLKYFYNGKVAFMSVSIEDYHETKTDTEAVDGFVEKILSVQGVLVGVLVSEVEGSNEIKLSFRSKNHYDIRQLAVTCNGGGHTNAAGGRVYDMKIDDVIEMLVNKISELKILETC